MLGAGGDVGEVDGLGCGGGQAPVQHDEEASEVFGSFCCPGRRDGGLVGRQVKGEAAVGAVLPGGLSLIGNQHEL